MKFSSRNFSKRVFTTLLSLMAILQVTAQNSTTVPLKDFVLYGKDGVNIAGATVDGGTIGSNVYVNTTSGPTIGANIHSLGTISLSNNTKVTGKLYAGPVAPQTSFTGNALVSNSGGLLSRNIYVNGNINLGMGYQLKGKVTQPAGATYTGPNLKPGQKITADPNIPDLATLSYTGPVINYTSNQNVNNTAILTPSDPQRKDVSLNGNKTLTFKGVGKYYLNSINNSNSNTIVFDFNGNTNSPDLIEIYVKTTVALGKSNVLVTGGGSASRVIMRVWGTGTAFNISNGNSGGIEWQGTVHAYNGDINLSSGGNATKVIGALFSNKTVTMGSSIQIVYAALDPCGLNVNAGEDKIIDCDVPTANLVGSGKIGNDVTYLWTAEDGGIVPTPNNSLTLSNVDKAGTYILTITYSGTNCPSEYRTSSDLAVVNSVSCVEGFVEPPPGGKDETYDVFDKTTTDLDVLYQLNGNIDPATNVTFQLRYVNGVPDKVLIDVITRPSYTHDVYVKLTGTYGMVDTIYNGSNSVIVTGWFPISNLNALNTDQYFVDKVSYVRPVYPAISKMVTGLAGGDLAMGSSYSRGGFKLTGEGYKIGVLSDSYNNKGGANTDIENRDLPGNLAGPLAIINPNPVTVLKDYPYLTGSDEGRSMLQILYDVAPKSSLYFRTGFLTAGDFAIGIQELADQGCHAIVDDISFITEPFFTDGVIAQAVKSVVAQGKHYVTAAGNYASKSYESTFVPATGTPLPFGIPGVAHNFGTGIYQSAIVKAQPGKPGIYTIGLQWEDAFSSLGAVGTQTDVDLYAINQAGEIIGFNRINLSADPMEIMSFVVNPKPTTEVVTEIKLMVVVDGTPPPGLYFKFIVFRGDFTFLNASAGANAGTIVGQANVPEAHTIGAVRYTTPTLIEPFTSRGGVRYYGSSSQKPDYVAPDGVNTSVDMGSLVDPEGDGIRNFFGTSASAPHVAGGIALLLEAQKKFVTDNTLTPIQIKDLIRNNVQVIPGTVLERGAGLVRIDNAIASFANPTPVIEGVQNFVTTGTGTQVVTIIGNYFIPGTTFRLNGVVLAKNYLNDSTFEITVPFFTEIRTLLAENAKISPKATDGGISNPYYFNAANRVKLTIAVDDKHKKFLGEMPAFTHKIYKRVDGVTSEVTDAAEIASYGLSNISYSTNALLQSNASVSPFNIAPIINTIDTAGKYIFFEYIIDAGALFVDALNVQVQPKNKNIVYGNYIGEIEYNYHVLDAMAPANLELALAYLELSHKSSVSSNAFALLDDLDLLNAADQQALKIALGLASDADAAAIKLAFSQKLMAENLAFMVSLKTVLSSRAYDIVNNKMVAAAIPNAAQLSVVDLNKTSFINYLANPNTINITMQQTISSSGTTSRGIVTPLAFNSAANVGGVNIYNSGYANTLLSINQEGTVNKLISKMPVFNGQIVHQLHGITNNGTATTELYAQSIVHYIYSMGLVQINKLGNFVSVPQGQPVVLSDGSIVANFADPNVSGVMCMKQILTADAEALKIAIDQKIALATNASLSLMNINGVLRYVDVNNQVVNPNAIIDLSAIAADLNAVALRVPLSTELSFSSVTNTYLFNNETLKVSRIVMAYAPNTSGGLGLMVSSGGLGLMVSSGAGGLGLMVSSGGLGLMVSSGGLGLMVSSGGLGLMVSSGGLGLIVSSGGLGLMVSSGGLGLMVSSGGLGLMVSSGGLGLMVTSSGGSTNGLANNTPIIFSQNEVDNGGIVGPNIGINLVTSLSVGENFIIGGAFINSNMNVHNLPGNLNITKAAPTVTVTAAGPYTYDGTPKPATGSATGVNNETLTPAVTLKYSGVSPTVYAETTTAPTNAGTYSVKAVFAGNNLYSAAESLPSQFTINKATANIVVTPYSLIYDGVAHTATGTATGVEATPANLAALLNLSGTTHTNAGTYNADAWSFAGNQNYEPANGTVNNVISKANAIIAVTPYSVTYNGTPRTAIGTATGVESPTPANLNSLLILSGTTHTDVGTYNNDAWSFAGNINYNSANGTVNNIINKANATVSITGGSFNYDGSPKAATGFAYGVGGVTDVLIPAITFEYVGTGSTIYPVSATAPSLPGTYSVTGTFAGNDNYNSSTGTATLTISNNCPEMTHGVFNSFTDASPATGPNPPTTTMWVQVKIKINGQLTAAGQYIDYNGGAVTFTGISMSGATTQPIPRGRVIAGSPTSPISSIWNPSLGMWVTTVPANLNTTSDIFISGAIVNSQTGFKKQKNTSSYTSITGSFSSNVTFSSRWLYSMAAYQVPVTFTPLFERATFDGAINTNRYVVSVNTQPYGSGTPMPFINYVVAGGTGSGNGNYTGNTSSLDQFTACSIGGASNFTVTKLISKEVEKAEPQMNVAPNPSRNNATISYVPAVSGKTSVKLFQVNGIELEGIFEGQTEAGQLYNWQLKTSRFPAGVYFVRLVNNGEVTTRKLVVMN
jgi:hypothetical protein